MLAHLSPKAKQLLTEQHDQLMLDALTTTTKVATVQQIIRWCDHEHIQPGKWIVLDKKYRFTRDGISKIQQTYLMIMQEDIFDDFSQDNHQTAAAKSADEKLGIIKPTHHIILTALTKNACFAGFQQAFYPNQQVNLELDIRELDFAVYDSLVMIENRDSFNDWHMFASQIKAELGNVLAIYRGDSQYSVAATKVLQMWRETRPQGKAIYFGDFDLAGLRIATSSQCTHLLLPQWRYLESRLVSQHYTEQQQRFLEGLKQDCPSAWRPLLQLMHNNRAGLRQQKMYQAPLVLY
ncbi:hypothetical protein [uncultured Paraglaciecola sp.]|uniref:DUF7281 domain-containing protein n=1 Tax=uncultured Paraglaciecola sp. TaxID=1765024 RepID=UPI0026235E2A|nr:hypothetical protein [uncultured Paraglaciecola sp.]